MAAKRSAGQATARRRSRRSGVRHKLPMQGAPIGDF